MKKDAGKIVKTQHDKIGRTYNEKGLVAGKVPVYLANKFDSEGNPTEYNDQAILCSPFSLTTIGFID